MSRFLAIVLLSMLISPVIHAEFMVQKALYSIGNSTLITEGGNLDEAIESELIDTLYTYHVRAFYTQDEITSLAQIAALERVVRDQCDADAPDYEPVSCYTFKDLLDSSKEAHFWIDGLRPSIRRLWRDKFGANYP
jgi:hypothetical protein